MAALDPTLFLTSGSPYHAAVQLIYKLPGKYRLVRRTHHTHIVHGTNLTYRDLVCPSRGTAEVTLRAATDGQYEVELMHTTAVELRTWDGQTATKVEKRAFRITNGQWSLWAVRTTDEGVDVVAGKLADLTLSVAGGPERVGPAEGDAVQKAALNGGPWRDGQGVNAVAMCVWVGKQPCWQLMHQVDRQKPAASEVCSDEFWPVVGDAGNG